MASHTLDLHGKGWVEALDSFIDLYNDAIQSGGTAPELDIIHGYGSTGAGGILRKRFQGFLRRYNEFLEFQPGEAIDGNLGHTVVKPIKKLPQSGDMLEEQVLNYCERARTQSKIMGRFRQQGDPEVKRAIRALQLEGRLKEVIKGADKMYQAA